MTYWPGTEIVKSTRNDFCWRDKISIMAAEKEFKAVAASAKGAAKTRPRTFTVYSKAVPK